MEYERVMEDESYMEEEWSNNIYDHVKRHIGKTQLSYCIKDLAGDGKPELILGVFRHEKYKILGTIYESEYDPFIIYTYDDEGIHWNCIPHYYKCEIDGDEYEDITEKEFYNIRNQYTAVREELEWRPVDGFWNAENIE